MKILATTLIAGSITLVITGCGSSTRSMDEPSRPSIDGSQFLLSSEPTDAQNIIAARASVQDDQRVTVVGRIGGSRNPWIDGRAAFSLVDVSLQSCLDTGDGCATPWDYCCESNIPQSMVLIKFTDESGNLIRSDARELLDIKELQTVVIQGKAQRDDAGNLTILASGMFKR